MGVTVAQLLIQIEADVSKAVNSFAQVDQKLGQLANSITSLSGPLAQATSLIQQLATQSQQSTAAMTAGFTAVNNQLRASTQATQGWAQATAAQQAALAGQNTAMQQQLAGLTAQNQAVGQNVAVQQQAAAAATKTGQAVAANNATTAASAQASKAAAQATEEHSKAISGLNSWLGRATASFAGFIAAHVAYQAQKAIFNGVTEAVIGYNAQLEMSANALGAMLRGVDKTTGALNPFNVGIERAQGLILGMQKLALESPFDFKDVQATATELLRMGVALKDVLPLTEAIQNVGAAVLAAGGSATEIMQRLGYAVGQINASVVVGGQEIRQLINAGVNIGEVYKIVGENIGKSTEEVYKLQRAGKLGTADFLKGFQEWVKINFGDMAAIQAKTFTGAMNNIHEAINKLTSTAFKPLFDRFAALANTIANLVKTDEFAKWATMIAAWVDVVADAIGELAGIFMRGLTSVFNTVISLGQGIYTALQWINPFARHSPSLVDSVESGVERIRQAFAKMGQEIPPSIQPAADAMVAFRQTMEGFKESRDIEEAIKALARVSPDAPAMYLQIRDAINSIRDAARELTPLILAQKEEVDRLTAAWKGAKAVVDDMTATIKNMDAQLNPLRDQIRGVQIETMQWEARMADVDLRILQETQNLKPYREEIKAAEAAQAEHQAQLDLVNADLERGTAELAAYKGQLTLMQSGLQGMEQVLSLAQEKLSGLNGEMTRAKALMSDITDKPLEGERDLAIQILQQQATVEKINAQILTAKAQGAKAGSTALTGQLERAQAQLNLLESRQRTFQIQHQRLKAEGDKATNPEAGGNFDTRMAKLKDVVSDVNDLRPQIDDAEGVVKAARGVVDAQKEAMRPIQEYIAEQEAAQAPLKAQRAILESLINQDKTRVIHAKAALEINSAHLHELEDEKKGYQEHLDLLKSKQKLLESQLAIAHLPIEALEHQRDAQKNVMDDLHTDLDTAKEKYDGLIEQQKSLVELAGAWETEMKSVVSEAIQLQHEQDAAAKKAAAGGAGGIGAKGGIDPNNPGPDLEALIAQAKAAREQFEGMTAALHQNFQSLKGEIAKIKAGLENNPIVQFLESVIEKIAPVLGEWAALAAGFAVGWSAMSAAWSAAWAILGPGLRALWGWPGIIMLAIATLHQAWVQDWGGIQEIAQAAFEAISTWLGSEGVQGALKSLQEFMDGPVTDAWNAFVGFINDPIIPLLGTLKDWFFEHIPGALETLGTAFGTLVSGELTLLRDFMKNEVEPRWIEFKRLIEEDVVPILNGAGGLKDTIINDIIPEALDKLRGFLNDEVEPRWTEFKRLLEKDVIPQLVALKDKIINETIPQGLTVFVNFMNTDVANALNGFRNKFTEPGGIFETLATFGTNIGTNVVNEAKKFQEYYDTYLGPVLNTFNAITKTIGELLFEVGRAAGIIVGAGLKTLLDHVGFEDKPGTLNAAWKQFNDAIDNVKTALENLKTWFANNFGDFLKNINDQLINGPLKTLTELLTKLTEWNNSQVKAATTPPPPDVSGAASASVNGPGASASTGPNPFGNGLGTQPPGTTPPGQGSISGGIPQSFSDRPSLQLPPGAGSEVGSSGSSGARSQSSAANSGIDYEKLGAAVASAMDGVNVTVDGQKLGQVAVRYIGRESANLNRVGGFG